MYHLNMAGRQSGPYELSEIREMKAAGSITQDTLCWADGWPDWKPLNEVVPEAMEPRVPRRAAVAPGRPQMSTSNAADPARVAGASLDELLCCRCGLDFAGAPKKTFFIRARKFTCDSCGHVNTYPPSGRAMKLYVGVLVFTGLVMISMLSQGQVPLPGLLAFVAGTGLVEGALLRSRVRKSRNFFREKALGRQ